MIIVKNLLRHFIPVVLVAIAFIIGSGNRTDSVALECIANTLTTETECCNLESPVSQLDLLFPRQISGTNIPRLQNATKRTSNTHRNNLEFVKAGKVINAGIISSIQKESLNIHISFIKPACRLISLGKLII